MLGGSSPEMRAVLETEVDLGFVESENLQRSQDFATGETCLFQDDAIETPNMDSPSHIFRVLEPKWVSPCMVNLNCYLVIKL